MSTILTAYQLNAAALLCERWGHAAFKFTDRVVVSTPTGSDWITLTPDLLEGLIADIRAAASASQEGEQAPSVSGASSHEKLEQAIARYEQQRTCACTGHPRCPECRAWNELLAVLREGRP